ncbi:MAG: EamA family transporter, partial [Comamonas sp.]
LLDPSLLLIGLGVALVSSAIPISLELFALKHLPKHVFGTMTSMEPAVAALLALVFLSEVLSWSQCLAIGLIMLASIGCAITAQNVQCSFQRLSKYPLQHVKPSHQCSSICMLQRQKTNVYD